jgi:hypothetical protein
LSFAQLGDSADVGQDGILRTNHIMPIILRSLK